MTTEIASMLMVDQRSTTIRSPEISHIKSTPYVDGVSSSFI